MCTDIKINEGVFLGEFEIQRFDEIKAKNEVFLMLFSDRLKVTSIVLEPPDQDFQNVIYSSPQIPGDESFEDPKMLFSIFDEK